MHFCNKSENGKFYDWDKNRILINILKLMQTGIILITWIQWNNREEMTHFSHHLLNLKPAQMMLYKQGQQISRKILGKFLSYFSIVEQLKFQNTIYKPGQHIGLRTDPN